MMSDARTMNRFVLLAVLVSFISTSLFGCRSTQQVCEDNINASRDKYHQCTPDSGGFGQFFDLAFSAALGACTNASTGCQKADGGTGTYNTGNADKCTADIKASSCSSGSSGGTAGATCSKICE